MIIQTVDAEERSGFLHSARLARISFVDCKGRSLVGHVMAHSIYGAELEIKRCYPGARELECLDFEKPKPRVRGRKIAPVYA